MYPVSKQPEGITQAEKPAEYEERDFFPEASNTENLIPMYTSPVLKQKILKTLDPEPTNAQITVEIIEYVPNSEPVETIIKKSYGKVSTMLVDNGEVLAEKTYPFETYAQVIDGIAEIVIAGEAFYLGTGQSIVIPPHAPNYIRPYGGFKMIMSMVKNGEL